MSLLLGKPSTYWAAHGTPLYISTALTCLQKQSSLFPYIFGVYEHRVYTETTFGVSTIDLSQGKFDLHRCIGAPNNKVSRMVVDPVPRIVQIALGHSMLTIGSC
jgi:hypothetical protein